MRMNQTRRKKTGVGNDDGAAALALERAARTPRNAPAAARAQGIQAILFDLDNTLIDYLKFKQKAARAAAKEMVRQGLPTSEEDAYNRIFAVYQKRGIEYGKTFYEVVVQFGLEVNAAEKIQQAGIIAHNKCKMRVLKPYPGVAEVLTQLRKNYLLAIVSDAPRNKVWQRLVIAGLEDFFHVVVTTSDTQTQKPHPSSFQLALQKLGVAASECMFVGDNPGRDVRGAKALGMKTCLARYGLWDKETDKADYEITEFSQLPRLLETI